METDQLRLNEMAYLHVPDKERSKSPSPADSLASSATDISTLPIHDRSLHRGDGEHVSCPGISLPCDVVLPSCV